MVDGGGGVVVVRELFVIEMLVHYDTY